MTSVALQAGHQRRLHWRLGGAGTIGVFGLVALVGVCTVGSYFAPPARIDQLSILQGPAHGHWLGTDFAGRDNLLLLVHGGREMLLLAAVAGLLMSLIAITIGIAGAYIGGVVDVVLVWLTDVWLTIPRFILLLVIASLIRIQSTVALAALIAVFGWPFLARQIRSQTLALKSREYVEAAQMLSLGRLHVVARYLFPALAPFIIISTIQSMTQAIYQQVGLAFFGVIPLTDNWGVLFSVAYRQNAIYLPAAAVSLLGPVIAICLLQLFLVLTSRALEEVFDPRLKGAR